MTEAGVDDARVASTSRAGPSLVDLTRPAAADEMAHLPPGRTHWIRWAIALLVALLPIVVACAALARRTWDPAGDRAIEVLRIGDVGTRHTPLTGSWSRFGWDHPGPLAFWVLAPFARLLGHRGVLVGVGVVNAAALTVVLVAARRRGGWPLVGVVTLGIATLLAALGTDLLVDPWNPWLAILPYLAYVTAAWCVAEGDHAWLAVMVAAGTFAVQAHVGYLLPVAVVGSVAVAVGTWRGAARAAGFRRSVTIAVVAGAALWSAPVLQQLFGARGNLGALLEFARHPTQATAGWATAWGVMGTELGFPGGWLSGGDDGIYGVRTTSAWPALLLLALVAGLGAAAWRRGSSSAGGLAAMSVVTAAAAVVTTARVSGPVWTYVVRWWWVTAALAWISVAWSAIELVRRADVVRWSGAAALTVAAVVSGVISWRAVPVQLPDQQLGVTSGRLGAATAAALDPDGRYIMRFADVRNWGGVANGVFVFLDDRGFDIAASTDQVPPYERWRTQAPAPGWTTLYVVGEDDIADGFRPPDPSQLVASYDPLTARQRARATTLLARVLTPARERDPHATVAAAIDEATIQGSPVDRGELAELKALRSRGFAYSVYAAGEPAG